MERLFRYSLERERAIRLIWLDGDGGMRQATAQVLAIAPAEITVRTIRPKRELTIRKAAVLSADYRKGDEGQADEA